LNTIQEIKERLSHINDGGRNLNDIIAKIKVKFSHIAGEFRLRNEFLNNRLTKDNLILFQNYVQQLGYKDRDHEYLVDILSSALNCTFKIESPEDSQNRIRIEIRMNLKNDTIVVSVEKSTYSIKNMSQSNTQSTELEFIGQISLNTCANTSVISNEKKEFIKELIEVIKDSFIHSLNQINW